MPPDQPISKKLLVFNVLLVMVIVVLVFLIYSSLHRPSTIKNDSTGTVVQSEIFDHVPLQAQAVYVWDVSRGDIIYQKNQDAQLPLASLTKLMTALVAVENVPKNSKIEIKKEFLTGEDANPLVPGEAWKLKDLLDFSLVSSSNDGAKSIASVIGAQTSGTGDFNIGKKDFVAKMNTRAEELGLNQTYFINESGLDESSTISGGYGSAVDVAKIMKYMLEKHSEVMEPTKYPITTVSSFSGSHTVKNTDSIINQIPNLLASKTGYTSLAGGNLAVAFDASIGRPIIVVVLGSTQDGRFSDVVQLVKASMEYVGSQ